MPSIAAPDVDSRCYTFSYLLESANDLPADFPITESAKDFQIGIFLPRDHPDWFGRSKYPPRILLLHDASIVVLTHPHYNAAPVQFELADVAFCEIGHLLLIGWLRFAGAGFEVRLPFNTRSERPMNEFLDSLMTAYVGGSACSNHRIAECRPTLDIKFRNHLRDAMRTGEVLCACWFSPPSERMRRWGPFRVRSERGGDVVACTNQRLIWIRDRWNDRYERYGSIASTAPLRSVVTVRCHDVRKQCDLTISLVSGESWRIPLSARTQAGAEMFSEAFAARFNRESG